MAEYNEQPLMHEEDITWANYKKLDSFEPDKIYFIKDLSNKNEMIADLKNDLKILTDLVRTNTKE